MQPISNISMPRLALPATLAAPPASTGGSFQDVWQAALRQAEALEAAGTAGKASATVETASQVCDRLLAAFHEIKDLRI